MKQEICVLDISSFSSYLLQYDAEILYLETKNKEQIHQMDFISHEVNRFESTGRIIEEQVQRFSFFFQCLFRE